MFRWIARIAWLALSAVLLVWVLEGLFGTDQSQSALPFLAGDTTGGAVIFLGVAWGVLLTFSGTLSGVAGGATRRSSARYTALAVGTVTEVSRTGLTVNDVPQYDIIVDVSPSDGAPFVSHLRMLVDPAEIGALQPGTPVPVRFDPERRDGIALADMSDPAAQAAVVQWRVQKGLIAPHLVAARTRGTAAPAVVTEITPTGRRAEGQVEIGVRLLVTPDGATPWEAATTAFVYPQALGRVQVGSPVYAMYEPHDPQTVALTIEKGA